MATTQFTETKQVKLSDVVEDLNSGLTKWKKDDIGFGSIEKKYNLTIQECIKLFGLEKIAKLEHKIPTFVIIDDLPETTEKIMTTVPEEEFEAPKAQAPIQAQLEVKKEVVQVVTSPVTLTTVKVTSQVSEPSLNLAF